MISVLVALEEPFVQMGVRVTIENTEGFEVTGLAETAEKVVPTVAALAPDILILDSHFQQADDKLVPQLTSDHPACKILVMVDHTDEGCTAALQAVAAGEVWTGPGLASYWMHSIRPPDPNSNIRITARELEVIEWVVSGLSNREIAQRLKLSEQMVKNHTARIMDKLGVRNRVELVLHAIRERLV